MKLTKAIIYAAAMDAYKAAKRAGKQQDACNYAYHSEFDRLFAIVGGPDGWMDLSNV
jgi:hypothetical protein